MASLTGLTLRRLWRSKSCAAINKTAAGYGEMIENQMAARQIGGGLDAIDEKLVSLLCRNARMTLTALAQEVALSRTAVQARMARLERDRVIVGYRAVVGERQDDDNLSAVLSITFSQRPCSPVVDKFRNWPEITNYYSVTGPLDAYMVVSVKNAQDLSRLVDRLSAISGVGSVRSAVVLKADFN
jgi:Lrp/AsnC family transcriptional regulator, leucine-responsive regulatory protein